jgi:apolipoprotein N-acyltransferase
LGKPTRRSPWMAEIILPFAAIFIAMFYGFHQLAQPSTVDRELKVTLVQPSIPQTMIWDESKGAERFQDLMQLSERALAEPTDVLIWPEAALPGSPIYEGQLAPVIADLARNHQAWLIIGADDVAVSSTETNYYNASFLINPQGKVANNYRKRGLVIFGEYIPLERWLPFIKWFTPITGTYTPGDKEVQFDISTAVASEGKAPSPLSSAGALQKFRTSVLICFEDVFPHLARKSVEPDTDFLVNITNDGWFGEGAAQWQQAAAATFRTIENGVPLIRCANTGITCWIDRHGRWQQVFTDKTGSVYGVGFMTGTVPLPDRHPPTFYNQHGDVFGWVCVAFAATAMLQTIRDRRRNAVPSAIP